VNEFFHGGQKRPIAELSKSQIEFLKKELVDMCGRKKQDSKQDSTINNTNNTGANVT
jgi:hypothetical protein